jgi:hypothetical protein
VTYALVVIVIVLNVGAPSAVAVTSIPMADKETCQKAAAHVRSQEHLNKYSCLCVRTTADSSGVPENPAPDEPD